VGREEDSAQSVFRLVPRPLLADSGRWLAQEGQVLRFGSQLLLPAGYPEHLQGDAQRRWGERGNRACGPVQLWTTLRCSSSS
jgi:hypothetical protein